MMRDGVQELLPTAALEFFTRDEDRVKTEDARHRETLEVHRDGWTKLAGAVERGLNGIAAAIRGDQRR